MKITLTAATVLATLGAALPALASSDDAACGNAPREQWMSESDARARGVELGYEVRRVKVEDNCYEIYAVDRNGVRAELYLNPVNGEIVRQKADD